MNVVGPFVWPVILNGAQAVYGQLVGEGRLHMAKRFFNEYSKPEVLFLRWILVCLPRDDVVIFFSQFGEFFNSVLTSFSKSLGLCICLLPPLSGRYIRTTSNISQ